MPHGNVIMIHFIVGLIKRYFYMKMSCFSSYSNGKKKKRSQIRFITESVTQAYSEPRISLIMLRNMT